MNNKQYIEEKIKRLVKTLEENEGILVGDDILPYFRATLTSTLAEREREIMEEIEKMIAIHEQLAEEWTGIKIDGSQVNINPHREKADILSDIKTLLTPRE